MKQFVAILLGILSIQQVSAQVKTGNSILGTVADAGSKQPLEYSTITVYAAGNNAVFTGTATDKQGSFLISDLPEGNYKIVFENIGYTAYTIPQLTLNKKDAIIDLKTILLKKAGGSLETVTVTAQVKLIDNKIDKLVFNAEKDLSSQNGVATDLLKKIPQVSVDADGNVQLAGNSGIRFLINGKPSTAFGSNVADVLQSIPASSIKSIEVITSPGAKYDAQGLGGIINIILKTNKAKGYNGTVSRSAGTRQESGSFSMNARKNDFGVNVFLNGSKRIPATRTDDNIRETSKNNINSSLQQYSESRFQRGGFQTGAGFDWTIKKKNNFSGNIGYNGFSFKNAGFVNQAFLADKNSGSPAILSLINSGNKSNFYNLYASLNYKRTFAKEDRELEMSLSIDNERNDGRSFSEQFALPQTSVSYGFKGYNPSKGNETEFTVDYTEPLAEEVNLGVGTDATFYTTKSNSEVSELDIATGSYFPDASQTYNLRYKQNVYAAYAEISFPAGKLFEAKLGTRYERTEISSYYSNAQSQVKVPGYNTLVPSVFLSKKLDDKQTLKLSYSKRIERPDLEDLNPFVNISDPKNLSAGNPYLKPELGHRIEMTYSRDMGKTGSLMANLFYRMNDHDIQPYIIYYPSYTVGDSVFTNVSVSTRQNIGRENNMGINLFGDFHLGAKLNIRSNVFLFQRHTINQLEKTADRYSFNYRFNINTSYQFTNTLLAEFFGNFNAARNEAQGKYPSFTSYNAAIRKQFWNKKGSIAFTAGNFLSDKLTQKTILYGTDFTVNGVRKSPFRSFGINFTWKFGKLEFKKSEEREPGAAQGEN